MDASEHRNLAPDLPARLDKKLRPSEIAWRALRALKAHAERSGLIGAPKVPQADLGSKPNFDCADPDRVGDIEYDDGVRIVRDGRSLRLTLPQADQARTRIYCGSLAPMAGWISRTYDSRLPAPTVVWQARLIGRSVLRSEILVG